MPQFTVATINIRNRQDRWLERRHLLVGQLVDTTPDIIGLQEVHFSIGQGRWLRNQINARLGNQSPYRLIQKRHIGLPNITQGLGVLTRLPVVYHDSIDLGYGGRLGLRVNVRLPNQQTVDFVTTHLHPRAPDREARLEQVMALTGWLRNDKWTPLQIVAGDFNEVPGGLAISYMKQTFRSAYETCHGYEPLATYPTALVEMRPPYDGSPGLGWAGCLDYIFIASDLRVPAIRLFLDKPADSDPHLYPSDHVGLLATLTV